MMCVWWWFVCFLLILIMTTGRRRRTREEERRCECLDVSVGDGGGGCMCGDYGGVIV